MPPLPQPHLLFQPQPQLLLLHLQLLQLPLQLLLLNCTLLYRDLHILPVFQATRLHLLLHQDLHILPVFRAMYLQLGPPQSLHPMVFQSTVRLWHSCMHDAIYVVESSTPSLFCAYRSTGRRSSFTNSAVACVNKQHQNDANYDRGIQS